MLELCDPKVEASTQAACHSGENTEVRVTQQNVTKPKKHISSLFQGSPILLLSGVPSSQARCTVRLSLGRDTDTDKIERVAETLAKAYEMATKEN